MASDTRVKKVADLILQVLSGALSREISDPRLSLVSFSAVEVTRDLAHAHVYVSTLGETSEIPEILRILERAQGFFRRVVAKECELRIVPHLHFRYDISSSNSQHISQLIDRALKSDAGTES